MREWAAQPTGTIVVDTKVSPDVVRGMASRGFSGMAWEFVAGPASPIGQDPARPTCPSQGRNSVPLVRMRFFWSRYMARNRMVSVGQRARSDRWLSPGRLETASWAASRDQVDCLFVNAGHRTDTALHVYAGSRTPEERPRKCLSRDSSLSPKDRLAHAHPVRLALLQITCVVNR